MGAKLVSSTEQRRIEMSTLKYYMKPHDRAAMHNLPTTHQNCIDKTGVASPGKTARDRASQIKLNMPLQKE